MRWWSRLFSKEGGLLKLCDTVWYLYASADVRVQRLMASRGYTKERCVSVMDRQLPETAFRRMADAVIDNSGNFEETKRQIARLLGSTERAGSTILKDVELFGWEIR